MENIRYTWHENVAIFEGEMELQPPQEIHGDWLIVTRKKWVPTTNKNQKRAPESGLPSQKNWELQKGAMEGKGMVTGQVQLFNAGMHEDLGQKNRGRPKKRRHGLSTSRTGFGEKGVMRSTTSQGPKISPLKFISEGVEEGIFAHPQEPNNTMRFGTSTQKPPDPGSTMEVDQSHQTHRRAKRGTRMLLTIYLRMIPWKWRRKL